MHRKVKFIVASFFLLPFFVLSEAYGSKPYGDCHSFVVKFDNQTPFNCNVIDSKLHHGYWVTPLIKTIAPYTMFSYTIKQSAFYGPDAEVTLRCGNDAKGYHEFIVKNQQNFFFLGIDGDQNDTVVSQDKGINVTNGMQQHAALFGSKPGIAKVTVKLSP